MKTNSNLKRLSALILAGSVAVLPASASETTTTATDATTTARPLHMTGEPIAKHGSLGAVTKDSQAPAGPIHRSAPDVRLAIVPLGSPAHRAGMRSGDVLWKFDGVRVKSTAQLKDELRHEKAGEVVPAEVFHHGQLEELNVKLGTPRTAHMMLHGIEVVVPG